MQSKGWKNLFFVPLFVLAIVANFASYATIKGMPPFPSSAVWQAMLWWRSASAVCHGRTVIPFFTAHRFNFEKAQPLVWLEWLANLPFGRTVCAELLPSLAFAQGGQRINGFAGVAQLVRFIRWKPRTTLSEPLVWSLHAAYLCIPLSLLLRGPDREPIASHNMLHNYRSGGLSGFDSGVSNWWRGHTGR